MSTTQSTADFIVDQLAGAGNVYARKMFGEYGLYCNDKVVGFICDNQLFIKPSEASAPFVDATFEAPPYPGAKMYLCVPEEKWEDRQWLQEFVQQTAAALPAPKPKNK